jgi:glutaredoxin
VNIYALLAVAVSAFYFLPAFAGIIPYNKCRTMQTVTFYTKTGCPLCVETEALLTEIKASHNIQIVKIDITADRKTFEKYQYEIPVIIFGNGAVLSGRIDRDEITGCLK